MASVKKKDPLLLLREHTMEKTKVHLSDDYLEFEDRRVHRDTKCGFRLTPKEPLLDIGSIFYMLRETSADRSYSQETARKRGFTYIGVASRSGLCDYIFGRANSCAGLVMDLIEGRRRMRDDPDGIAAVPKRARDDSKAPSTGPSVASTITAEEISHNDVEARVRPVKDLDVLVRCPSRMIPNADLILKIAQDEVRNWQRGESRAMEQRPSGRTPMRVELEEQLRRDRTKNPIILVPCNKNAPVNLLNVMELLQDGIYKRPDEERLRFFESTRPEYVEVQRNIAGRLWTFEVRDTAKSFTKAQWLRTVCVVTDASDWQFKAWPFETIVDLFTTVKGIFFQPVGTMMPVHIGHWPVSVLKLAPPHLGHRFAQVRDAFFLEVEQFMNSYRQKRFANHTSLGQDKRPFVKPLPIL